MRPWPPAGTPHEWVGARKGDGCLHRRARQVRILSKDIINRIAVIDTAQHGIDRHPGAADDRGTAHELLIDDDLCVTRGTIALGTVHNVAAQPADIEFYRGRQF